MSSKRCPKVDKDGFTLVESKRTKKKEVPKTSHVSQLHTNRNDRDKDDLKCSTNHQDSSTVNNAKKSTSITFEKAKTVKYIQESKEVPIVDKKKELLKVNAPFEIGTTFNLPKSYSEISAAQTDIKQKSELDSNFERIIDIQQWPKIEEKVVPHDENMDKIKVTVFKPTVTTASVDSSNSTSPSHFRRKPANITTRSDHQPNMPSTVANDFGYRPRKRSNYGAELNNNRFSYGFPKPMYQPRIRNVYQHGVRLPAPTTFANNNRVMYMSQQQQPPPRADMCAYSEQIYVNDCNGTIDVRSVIRNQIEYYFSDQNLSTDVYLRHNMDENGYVIVTLLMKFRKIKLLTNDILLIIDAIRESDKLELITGDYKVRTKNNPKNWILASVNNEIEAAIYPSIPPPALNPELIRVLRDQRNIGNGNHVVYYQTSG